MHAALLDPTKQFALADDHDVIGPPLVREQLEAVLGAPRREGQGDPERALMRAILLDAVLCLVGQSAPAKDRPRLAADARVWVTSRSREWIFAFENVCDALGFNAGYIRARLLAFTVAGSDASQPATCQMHAARAVRGFRKSAQRRRRSLHFVRREPAEQSA